MTVFVTMPAIGTAQAWRDAARGLISANVPPCDVSWGDETTPAGLWDSPPPPCTDKVLTVPKEFVSIARSVVWHSDPARFSLLYQVLWRLRDTPRLLQDRADPELARLRQLQKNVHRCQHKMKAFVRFREIGSPDDPRRSFAAWFEPSHFTVEPTAPWFARRFGDMDWRIITPSVTASFTNGELRYTEGQSKPPLPEDASEQLWTTYFRNIFNPARVKVKAMQSEMPKKYWKNMPEAAAIPDLIASAPARVRAMNDAAPTLPPLRVEKVQQQLAQLPESVWSGNADALRAAISACTRCPLHCHATQAVHGEGPIDAPLMIVGEQPGDTEDLAGRPFVGPAGKLLDQLCAETEVDRSKAYVTNAVKHFKFKPRGKRRIHQQPSTTEVEQCKWWLDAERVAVQPRVILAMGASAALSLTGNGKDIRSRRGKVQQLEDGTPVVLTFHPSYLLRLQDPDARKAATDLLRTDLTRAHRLAQDLAVRTSPDGGGVPDQAVLQ
ncbi:UdgX family uracil-DNA binding protein [Neptunicoccus cionae]|uniref:UdgX family uracil-DNA binding protein n=1 Tax=Neptunicoccus cionae TaxID=2035344 RepID=UPI000C763874|nr:UdgX family uracil-DNA binding protein [Amylibacter cionae]PLS21512.1 uracil-DNA glycosylase [Amylibacter cionae]